MGGPVCEVLLESVYDGMLDGLHELLVSVADRLEPTRKGRVWDLWIGGQPYHVAVEDNLANVTISAGCNAPEDHDRLRNLADAIAERFGGIATPPET